ncbi:amidase [Aquibaculum arenosum]|uniref:Amidase n=1 Tax=Aquibaculum arenosum TaxID=3032591 RepID=A0ABT5YLE6_9PROT|nr:amidase [Fodinicurvata sp. CAU 1616]MDF2095765.1 amidase [Fodinicurvata sp. CAU 1616]
MSDAARSQDPALLSATELLSHYAAGTLSPVEATEAAFKAIERHDSTLNAFCLLDREGALAAARESEARWQAGRPQGRLDGVPTSVKDLLVTKGWPTRRGSRTTDDTPSQEDAPSVGNLRRHGAVLIGKTTTPEFGWKGVTDNPLTGITRNPWNPAMTPGGSSGGAGAAAAMGMGALHFGTDGGGSIRMPCGFCGIPGIKQSFGRVSAHPLSPFASVSHVGPMTRTVADSALMLTVMAGPDPRDPYSLPASDEDFTLGLDGGVKGLRIAYSPDLGMNTKVKVDPEIATLVAAAVQRFSDLGAQVEEVDLSYLPDPTWAFRVTWYSGAGRLLSKIPSEKQELMDPGLREIAAEGDSYSLRGFQESVSQREAYSIAMARFHQDYDLLLTPGLPIPAFEAGREWPEGADVERWCDWSPFTWPFNLTGQPAASVPCGLTAAGLPAALQIVGPRHADALVLRAAHAFEQAAPFALPPGAGSL